MPDRLPTAGELARRRFDPDPQEETMMDTMARQDNDVRPGDVSRATEELVAALDRLEHQAHRLVDAVAPVLRPENAMAQEVAPATLQPALSPLAQQLIRLHTRATELADHLYTTANRVDL